MYRINKCGVYYETEKNKNIKTFQIDPSFNSFLDSSMVGVGLNFNILKQSSHWGNMIGVSVSYKSYIKWKRK